MAIQEHLDILKQGVEVWNQWRQEHPDIPPDLSSINLFGANLSRIELFGANLSKAELSRANLSEANLGMTNLWEAMLSETDLSGVYFGLANLSFAYHGRANLSKADFGQTNLSNAILKGADLSGARIGLTNFGGVNLSVVKGLETVLHGGPSTVDIDTIVYSNGNIPEIFLRGAGVPDSFITYAHSLIGKPVEYYSCFISYSSKDQDFADRLCADLQVKGIRCWFAPEHLKIGDKFRHRIDESIRVYDKLLLVLSEASLASTWVGFEVEKALDKEPERKPNVLFPIRLDKAVLTCETDWAKDIRRSRHIGDFEHWKDHDAYQVAFERLLRDLKSQQ